MNRIAILLIFLLLVLCTSLKAEKFPVRHQQTFEQIYKQYPAIPVGLIEAIAFNNTRMRHITEEVDSASCTGMPRYYGIMGLIADGQEYFRNSLDRVAQLSGVSSKEILQDPQSSVMAYAAAMNELISHKRLAKQLSPVDLIPEIIELSELPLTDDIQNDFAMNSDLYIIFTVLQNEEFRSIYNIPYYDYDIKELFGDNYKVLSATRVNAVGNSISSDEENPYTSSDRRAACTMPNGPIQYPIALWNQADPSNYSDPSIVNTRETIAIHTVQGKYTGCISWFKNPSSNVSTQYVCRSYDGQITQMACHAIKCWHVASQNGLAVGIEHEGYIDDGATWYTTEMYTGSSDLVRYIADTEGVNKLQTYDGPPTDGIYTLSHTCYKIKGHQHFTGNGHTDPGPQFEWTRFYRLLNAMPAPTSSSTSATGTMYDSGGAAGNYANEERTTYVIDPAGNDPVQLTFTSWDVEDNWDFLWIYDGTDDTGALIGKYSGTTPGTVTAYSGSVFMEFRSDCGTSGAGWSVNWTTVGFPSCLPPTGVTASNVQPMNATVSWNTVAGATGYKLLYKPTFDATWLELLTTNTSVELSGLRSSAEYEFKVRTTCSSATDTSAYAGNKFTTPAIGEILTGNAESYSATACSGDFYDSGGLLSEYGNYQDWTYTIEPAGATSITVTFSSFSTENGYDFLKIHDGPTTSSSLIGSYTGTNSPGTIVSSGGALTFHFTSDNWTMASGWAASWTCNGGGVSTDPTTLIDGLSEWYTDDFNVSFTDTDNSGTGLQEEFYQVLDYDGTEYRGNADLGFFYDGFNNTLSTDWNLVSGTWTESGGVLTQSDETPSNTNLYANVTQGNGIYLYHWQMKIGGSGTNRRAGLHFFCDMPTNTQRGNSYMVYFRVDNSKTQIYKSDPADNIPLYTDDNTTVNANQWYDYKVLYNSFTGDVKAYQNDILVSSWTDPSPLTSGNSISLRTGNCSVEYDDFKVYKYRGATETVTVGNIGTEAVQHENVNPSTPACQINTVIIDNTETWSDYQTAYANIDWTAPASVIVYDGPSTDIDTTYDNTQLIANWTTSTDVNSDLVGYWYQVGTTPGASDVVALTDNGNGTLVTIPGLSLVYEQLYYVTVYAENGAGILSAASTSDGIRVVETCRKSPTTHASTAQQWYSDDFTVNFTDVDSCITGIAYSFYQALDFDGTEWRGNNTQGFFNDDFDATIHSDWTVATGTWSIDFLRLKQSDESLSNTNIYASLAQTGTEVYMYEWDALMDGAGGNRRGGLHFFCDDPTLTNRGNSYFVWFRVDNNKMQIYKVTNDVFSLEADVVVDVNPGQIYNNKVIYSPQTGDILVYRDNEFIGSWTDPSPLTSGNSISLRSGNALMYYDNVRVYKGRAASELVTVGQLSMDEVRYQNPDPLTPSARINSVIIDNSDLVSPVNEYYVNIDWTAPSTVSVIDGIGTDIDQTFSTTQLTGSWSLATDDNSGIANYWYAIGDTPGGTNIVNWTSSALDTAVTQTGLSLTYNTTYYFSVKVTNGAGITSTVTSSDGQIVLEALAPVASADVSYCSGDVIANVSATDNYGGTLTWYSDVTLNSILGTGSTYSPSNTLGTTTYYVTETSSGNESLADSVKVTIYSLPNANAGNNTAICTGSSTTLTATGGTSYIWDNSLGSGASHSVSPTVSTTYTVTVTDGNNCSATDMVSITVNNLPIISAGSNATICSGTNATLTATGGVSYVWDNTLGSGASQTVAPTIATVYNVTGTDNNQCSNSSSVTISVNALPTINDGTITITNADCATSNGSISGIVVSGSGLLSYVWKDANSVTVGTAIDLSAVGAGVYTLYVTDDNCTASSSPYTISENGAPSAPTVGGTATYCQGETVSGLTASGAGGTLTWYADAGLTSVITTGTSYNPGNITVTTSYYVTESQGGCESSATQATITINAVPTANAGADKAICLGDGTTLVATGGSTYMWDNGLGAGAAHNVAPTTQTTYTVTVTQNGCSDVGQVTISVTTPPTANAGNNVSICAGESTTITASGGSSYEWNNSLGSGASHVVSPSTTTTYTVTVTDNGCTDTDQVTVSVTAIPVANAGNDKTICPGTSATLTATGGTSYQWDNGLGSGATHVVSPTVNTTYTVTVTTNGCSATDQVNVSLLSSPTANAGNDQTICYGNSANLVASGGVSYVWSNSLGAGNNKTVTPTVTTTYTVTVTGSNGCTASDMVTISVTPLPNANAGNDKTICEGGVVTLTASGGTSYIWDNGLGSGATKNVSPTTTTTYTVTVTNNGCSASDAVTLSVTQAPMANAGNDQTICVGQATTISASGGTDYVWSNGLGAGATQQVMPTMTTIYTVSVSDGTCEAADQVTVFVSNPPVANAGTDEVICEGESVILMATGGTSYNWDNGLGTGATQSVSPTSNIVYTVTVTENGCSATDQVSITVNPVPVADFYSNETVNYEPDFSVSFVNTSLNATGYSWQFGDGGTSTAINPTYVYSAIGTYSVTLTASNGLCADDVKVLTDYIDILPTTVTGPTADFSVATTDVCTNKGLHLQNTSQNADSYLWEIVGQGFTSTSTAINPSFAITASGTYDITLTATSSLGTDVSVQNISVNIIQGAEASFIASDTVVVPNDVVTLTNTSTGGTYYCWDFADGSITCGNNPTVFQVYQNLGDYEVNLILVDATCGNDTATQTIHVVDPSTLYPTAQFTPSKTVICQGDTISITNSSLSADTYSWSISNGSISDATASEPIVTLSSVGSVTLTLTVSNANGTDVSTQTLQVNPLPVAIFVASDTLVDVNNGVVGFTNNSLYGNTYAWDFGDGNTSATHTPWNDYNQAGYYTVSLSVTNGCGTTTSTMTDYIHVMIRSSVEELLSAAKVRVYPNPVYQSAIIELNVAKQDSYELMLMDVTGRAIMLQQAMNMLPGNYQIPLNVHPLGISQGVYLLKVRSSNEETTYKIVVQ